MIPLSQVLMSYGAGDRDRTDDIQLGKMGLQSAASRRKSLEFDELPSAVILNCCTYFAAVFNSRSVVDGRGRPGARKKRIAAEARADELQNQLEGYIEKAAAVAS